MQIDTTRFGRIEITEDDVIHFPRGLYGLEGTRHYCLLKHDEGGWFYWLQAVDAPSVAMVVTDPCLFFPEYEVPIPDPVAEMLQVRAAGDVAVYTSITVAGGERSISANLLGPIVINASACLGLQLILDGARYTTQHRIVPNRPVEEAA